MKKYLLIILIICALLIIAGILLLLKSKNKSSASSIIAAIVTSPSPSPYPKIEKFEVPVLMYHYIRVAPEGDQLGANLSVSPESFAAQAKWLHDDGYRSIKLADLADPDRKEISRVYAEKHKPIVLTFDDGYADAYSAAFPVLKKYQFIGTFFIITDYVGRDGRLNAAQIDEMQKAGMEFGSHTLTHPDLTKLGAEDARSQIFDSKGDYQTFCYPSGRFNEQVVALVKKAGYLAAVTTKIGIARETSNLLEIPRVRAENTSPQALVDKISYAQEQGI